MKTKERILSVATDLFNHHGAGNISANRIAKELSISAGNLHYHYKNKEEIIQAIWSQMTLELDRIWSIPEIHHVEEAIARLFADLSRTFHRYRFFYLELPILLHNNPILRKDYVKRSERILGLLRVLTDSWVAAGIMKKPASESDKRMLIRNMWLVNQMWMHYWQTITSEVTEENIKDGMLQVLAFYKPYLRPKPAEKIYAAMELMS